MDLTDEVIIINPPEPSDPSKIEEIEEEDLEANLKRRININLAFRDSKQKKRVDALKKKGLYKSHK